MKGDEEEEEVEANQKWPSKRKQNCVCGQFYPNRKQKQKKKISRICSGGVCACVRWCSSSLVGLCAFIPVWRRHTHRTTSVHGKDRYGFSSKNSISEQSAGNHHLVIQQSRIVSSIV